MVQAVEDSLSPQNHSSFTHAQHPVSLSSLLGFVLFESELAGAFEVASPSSVCIGPESEAQCTEVK